MDRTIHHPGFKGRLPYPSVQNFMAYWRIRKLEAANAVDAVSSVPEVASPRVPARPHERRSTACQVVTLKRWPSCSIRPSGLPPPPWSPARLLRSLGVESAPFQSLALANASGAQIDHNAIRYYALCAIVVRDAQSHQTLPGVREREVDGMCVPSVITVPKQLRSLGRPSCRLLQYATIACCLMHPNGWPPR